MLSKFVLVSLCLLLLPNLVVSGNILFWLNNGAKSHLNVWKPLALELARRGHQITFVAPKHDPDLAQNANVTFGFTDVSMEDYVNSTSIFEGNYMTNISGLIDGSLKAQRIAYNLPMIQDLIKSKTKFDAAIFTPVTNDIGIYLAKQVFKAPIIYFFIGLRWPLMDVALGNPTNPSYIPIEYLNIGQNMNFYQRTTNTLLRAVWPTLDKLDRMAKLEAGAQELLNLTEKPDLAGMSYDASFGLYHSHPILDGVRPLGPNTAEVGPIHTRPAKLILDETLRKWLDEAKEGFIYVSFGSVLSGSSMPDSTRLKLLDAFKALDMRVLWKWETEQMEGEKEGDLHNIMLKKWLPQQDVLGHPNCKLFLTHGGLMSTYESLYHAVPMIVMPGFSDQFSNAARASRDGYGKIVYWSDLKTEDLISSMREVLSEPSYRDSVNFVSKVLRDQLTDPLERAVYHVEYVIRHKGAQFLRSPIKNLNWFQSHLVDVWLFIATVLILTIYLLCTLIMWTCKKLFRKCYKKKTE